MDLQVQKGFDKIKTNLQPRARISTVFDVNTTDLMSSSTRDQFKERIGWIEDEKPHWDAWDVEILHGRWTGEFNIEEIFRGESLKRVSPVSFPVVVV
jgi:hypothetical protein